MKTFIFALFFSALLTAQSEAPSLTETQRLQIQVLSQRLEIAQLKAVAAQKDFDAAREEITRLLTSLTVEGYTLNTNTWKYDAATKP